MDLIMSLNDDLKCHEKSISHVMDRLKIIIDALYRNPEHAASIEESAFLIVSQNTTVLMNWLMGAINEQQMDVIPVTDSMSVLTLNHMALLYMVTAVLQDLKSAPCFTCLHETPCHKNYQQLLMGFLKLTEGMDGETLNQVTDAFKARGTNCQNCK